MAKGLCLLVISCLAIVGQTLTPSTYITAADKERFKAILLAPYGDDLGTLAYSSVGLALIGTPLPEPQKACEAVRKNLKMDDLESLFHATFVLKDLKTAGKPCDVSMAKAEATLNAAITPTSSSITIMEATMGLTNLGFSIDAVKVGAALDAAMKADDSPLSYAYALQAASFMKGDLKKYHDLIEDIIAQADEIDDKYLQFEGGFITTVKVVLAAYSLSAAANLPPTLTEDKVIKFSNYFLSRKHTESVREIACLLMVMKTLTTNKFHIPVAVTLSSAVSVSEKSPLVSVRVNNLMGENLGKVVVTADTARHLGDDAVVLSKKPFAPSSSDASLFELDLMKVKPEVGFYRITISIVAQPPDAKLLGASGAEVEVKVVSQAAVQNMEISVTDKEQMTVGKSTQVKQPDKVKLEADYHQRLIARFNIVDKSTGKEMKAHQTFVRLVNTKTKQEVIFVAEEDASGAYKFDLDVGAKAKEFNNLAGKYTMDLIVGDAVIENTISWTVAEVDLNFHDDPTPSGADEFLYGKRPEINHMFREPEKRPPALVSNLFTALVFLPVLILFVLWLKIGVNISNFPFSLSAVGFHVGLSAIFGLYFCYFLKLNMFTTLRYLGLIGIPTFLFGNKLLSAIAARRKQH